MTSCHWWQVLWNGPQVCLQMCHTTFTETWTDKIWALVNLVVPYKWTFILSDLYNNKNVEIFPIWLIPRLFKPLGWVSNYKAFVCNTAPNATFLLSVGFRISLLQRPPPAWGGRLPAIMWIFSSIVKLLDYVKIWILPLPLQIQNFNSLSSPSKFNSKFTFVWVNSCIKAHL